MSRQIVLLARYCYQAQWFEYWTGITGLNFCNTVTETHEWKYRCLLSTWGINTYRFIRLHRSVVLLMLLESSPLECPSLECPSLECSSRIAPPPWVIYPLGTAPLLTVRATHALLSVYVSLGMQRAPEGNRSVKLFILLRIMLWSCPPFSCCIDISSTSLNIT